MDVDDHGSACARLRTRDLSWQVAGDSIVVLDLQGSEYLRLNGTGRTIWELLVEPRTVEELVNIVMDEYDIDRDTATTDTERFIDDLARRGLIER